MHHIYLRQPAVAHNIPANRWLNYMQLYYMQRLFGGSSPSNLWTDREWSVLSMCPISLYPQHQSAAPQQKPSKSLNRFLFWYLVKPLSQIDMFQICLGSIYIFNLMWCFISRKSLAALTNMEKKVGSKAREQSFRSWPRRAGVLLLLHR